MGWNGWCSSDDVHEIVCIGLRDIGKASRDTFVEIEAVKERCAVIGEEGLLRKAWTAGMN
jgi:hypothetical protein